MTDGLSRLDIVRLVGDELFTDDGVPVGFDVRDFWQWASSDLVVNVVRGLLAEYLVAKALDLAVGVRDPWLPYDLKTSSGLTLEVKSGAYIQTWWQRTHSDICFSIGETRSWSADTNTLAKEQRRQADAYVFALLKHRDKKTVNPRELGQWEFYVVPTRTLAAEVGRRKQLSLKSLLRIQPTPVSFQKLKSAIEQMDLAWVRGSDSTPSISDTPPIAGTER